MAVDFPGTNSKMTLLHKEHAPDPALSIGILLLDGFNLTSFSNFVDILRLAADKGLGGRQRNCRWSVLSPGSSRVRSSCGISINVEKYPPVPAQFDYLLVFGNTPDEDYYLEERARAYIQWGPIGPPDPGRNRRRCGGPGGDRHHRADAGLCPLVSS